jgi:hypothetical protein
MSFHAFLDIQIKPDFNGLPPQVLTGLTQLSNNAAAILLLVSGLGIVVSLLGMLAGSWLHLPHLSERMRHSLILSILAIAVLYLGVLAANYSARLFA